MTLNKARAWVEDKDKLERFHFFDGGLGWAFHFICFVQSQKLDVTEHLLLIFLLPCSGSSVSMHV